MTTAAPDPLPDDTDALKAALIETRAKLVGAQALIEHLQLVIAKMKREIFGPRSERSQRLLDQLELQLEERKRAIFPYLVVGRVACNMRSVMKRADRNKPRPRASIRRDGRPARD